MNYTQERKIKCEPFGEITIKYGRNKASICSGANIFEMLKEEFPEAKLKYSSSSLIVPVDVYATGENKKELEFNVNRTWYTLTRAEVPYAFLEKTIKNTIQEARGFLAKARKFIQEVLDYNEAAIAKETQRYSNQCCKADIAASNAEKALSIYCPCCGQLVKVGK